MGSPQRPRSSRRRTPRASLACDTCRIRKTKCDQARPCSYCAYHALDCVYRTAAANEGLSRAGNRHVHAGGSQRDTVSQPSPWPRVKQRSSQDHRSERRGAQAPAPGHINSPTPLPGDARVPRGSDAVIEDRTPEAAGREVNRGTGANENTSEPHDSASRDGLSGVNLHTNSTEFYGNSSNLAFLGNLYAGARNQAGGTAFGTESVLTASTQHSGRSENRGTPLEEHSPLEKSDSEDIRTGSDKTHPSIVNLLYNPDYSARPLSESQRGYQTDNERTLRSSNPGQLSRSTISDRRATIASGIGQLSVEAKLEIERMFISSYFSNKHYIHPVLCKKTFMRRCEQETWNMHRRTWPSLGQSKFAGLYFAVVALGAINATPNETSLLEHYCTYSGRGATGGYSTLDFADFYFGVTKQALGDIFESSSIESTQALLLMCAFCQNALRPHSCFMYSGMAVRTAMAIGLASGMSSLPVHMRKEGKRTWWAIYSHEVEMCVSSGRLDSVKELHYYKAPMPTLKEKCDNPLDPEAEDDVVAIIPVMVSLSHIMFEASHLLYHSTTSSLADTSQTAMAIDQKILDWKANLPGFLDLDAPSLNDPEWAFKQKFALKLRFYNARMVIHRPFVVASTSTTGTGTGSGSAIFHQHVRACLDAARASIQMQYDAFLHKFYVRTWWYNTTYALYATMILLHLILSNVPDLPDDGELITDVEKSLDIFASMNNLLVARRCAEMIREVLDVARTCVARRRWQITTTNTTTAGTSAAAAAAMDPPDAAAPSPPPGFPFNLGHDGAGLSGGEGDFISLFAGQDSAVDAAAGGGSTRAGVLANLVDPGILEDFAFGGSGSDYSIFWGS